MRVEQHHPKVSCLLVRYKMCNRAETKICSLFFLSFFLSDAQAPLQEVLTNHSNGCLSPDSKPQGPLKSVPRPLSPDSPEIIDELQRYTCGAGGDAAAESSVSLLPSSKPLQGKGGGMNHHDASVANVIQPNTDAAQDLRIGTKRKASTPPLDEGASKQPFAGKLSSATLPSQGFPFTGGYGLPPVGLNSAMLGGSLRPPLFMGSGSHYFHPPAAQLGDPSYMYPDLFGMNGTSSAPTPSSSSSSATPTSSVNSSSSPSSSALVKATSSLPGAVPPFMLNPGVPGMLPLGFPLSYTPSLASLYSGSMLQSGELMGTPGAAGASFLSQYPPTSASSSSSSSPCSFSPSARPEGQRAPVLVNSRDVSSNSSSDDEDDDDEVIEVKEQ